MKLAHGHGSSCRSCVRVCCVPCNDGWRCYLQVSFLFKNLFGFFLVQSLCKFRPWRYSSFSCLLSFRFWWFWHDVSGVFFERKTTSKISARTYCKLQCLLLRHNLLHSSFNSGLICELVAWCCYEIIKSAKSLIIGTAYELEITLC